MGSSTDYFLCRAVARDARGKGSECSQTEDEAMGEAWWAGRGLGLETVAGVLGAPSGSDQ